MKTKLIFIRMKQKKNWKTKKLNTNYQRAAASISPDLDAFNFKNCSKMENWILVEMKNCIFFFFFWFWDLLGLNRTKYMSFLTGQDRPATQILRHIFLNILHAKYSSVPNRRACMFINFEKKIPPARPYFGLHVYWFWEKIPPCTFIRVALKFKIKSSKLKTAYNLW